MSFALVGIVLLIYPFTFKETEQLTTQNTRDTICSWLWSRHHKFPTDKFSDVIGHRVFYQRWDPAGSRSNGINANEYGPSPLDNLISIRLLQLLLVQEGLKTVAGLKQE